MIISGTSHDEIFDGMIDGSRVHTVVNFAQDNLFVSEAAIEEKFAQQRPLRVLYISNMIAMKGFNELADAYFGLDADSRARIRIDFAGGFDFDDRREAFMTRVESYPGIKYHGKVSDEQKQALFAQAHVFCLPTAFLEGQPISILEAYASGCFVVTTGQPGIRDVFSDGLNGDELSERTASGIGVTLTKLLEQPDRLRETAMRNRRAAGELYQPSRFGAELLRIVELQHRL